MNESFRGKREDRLRFLCGVIRWGRCDTMSSLGLKDSFVCKASAVPQTTRSRRKEDRGDGYVKRLFGLEANAG